LNEKTLELVAERFRLLGDPLRLRLLQTLQRGERSVADLVAATGATQANVSKHLQLMLRGGVVQRRREGLFVYYSIRDARVFELCGLVCGSLTDHFSRELSSFAETPSAPARARSRRKQKGG
jgi:DNA-binding transcriptional ArsR family regulator